MRIQSNYPQYSNVNNSTSFKRLNIKKYINRSGYLREQKYIKGTSSNIAAIINVPRENVYSILKNASDKRFSFFKRLAEAYNARNFYLSNEERESSKFLLDIYEKVSNPTKMHIRITNRHCGTMESLGKIFELAQNEKSLKFVEKLQRKILGTSEESANKIVDLLSSKHSKKFIEKPKHYASYLQLTKNNKNAVNELDNLIDNNLYDSQKYDAELDIKNILKGSIFNFSDKFNTELINNYSKYRNSFLTELLDKINLYHKGVVTDSEDGIMEMYKSTNKKNRDIRVNVISEFMNSSSMYRSEHREAEELESLKTVFEKIDENNDVKKFVDKALKQGVHVGRVAVLEEVLSTVPIKKATIFMDNIDRILSMTHGAERKDALINNIEDPFFIPESRRYEYANSFKYGFREKDGFFTKVRKNIQNKLNQLKYNKVKDNDQIIDMRANKKVEINETSDKALSINQDIKKPEQKHLDVVKKKAYTKPEMIVKESEVKKPEPIEVKPVVKEPEVEKLEPLAIKLENKKPEPVAVAVEPEHVITKPEIKKPSVAKSKVKKQKPAVAKPKVKQQKPVVPEVIVPNVEDPTINAVNKKPTVFNPKESKMFSYIRQQLGNKVNSENKELITFMIKHKDSNGNNLFKANDIISLINKEDGYLRKQKRLNFRYDTKTYYNDLLEMMKEEYASAKA